MKRHFLSMVMEKIQFGFDLNLGEFFENSLVFFKNVYHLASKNSGGVALTGSDYFFPKYLIHLERFVNKINF